MPTESEIKHQIGLVFYELTAAIHKGDKDWEYRKANTLNSLANLYASKAYALPPAPRPPYTPPGTR